MENENREKSTKEPHPFLQLMKYNSLEYYMLFISWSGPLLNCISILFLNKLFHECLEVFLELHTLRFFLCLFI